MAEGRLYEVDMRLRPSGRKGPVATSLAAWQDYQMAEAWTWEHLALTRARVLAGQATLAGEVEAFRRSLLAAKGRGRDMPVPVLVGSWTTIDGLVYTVPNSARELIRACWPGALSLVVHQAPSLRWDLGDANGTVMLRMPLHPVAIEVLRQVGPMAVSSANISGHPPAVTAQDARAQLGDRVEVYLDGGPAAQQSASTIVDLTGPQPVILRQGPVTAERVGEVLGIDPTSLHT